MTAVNNNKDEVREYIREKYATIARQIVQGGSGCCGSGTRGDDPITRDLYTVDEAAGLPEETILASLGCGNPTALIELKPGETVLDLGSGGGIDVLLSARRVGPTGKAYGLDMADEMLALARENQKKAGIENVEFLKGTIENIPLPDNSLNIIISNCVINLSPDKDQVFREAFRVLRPGGRLAVSDVVFHKPVSETLRRNLELWAGCVAGALSEEEYRMKLTAAGFGDITITPTRIYTQEDVTGIVSACCSGSVEAELEGVLMSAFIRASKPVIGAR